MNKLFKKLILYCVVFIVASGCATLLKKAPQQHPKAAARPQHVDVKAQQQYYDEGLQLYSKENYGEAKEAFQEVIDLGPNTPLGLKAKENLTKIDQILKTLKEIESR